VKVVESILRDEIVQHLENYSLINQSQHGFRKGFSCATNLLSFLESVTASVDAKFISILQKLLTKSRISVSCVHCEPTGSTELCVTGLLHG